MKCRICANDDGVFIEVPFERIRHQDFTALGQGGALYHCKHCGAIQNIAEDLLAKGQSTFSSTDYSQSRQNCQTVNTVEFKRPVTRSFLQAAVLTTKLPHDVQRILDIGCFDGELLKQIQARWPGLHYHGFDVNPHLQATFPQDDGFCLFTGELGKLQGPYDLITLSHSIMYFGSLSDTLETVKNLLGKNGQVFIQVPNIDSNPCNILLADQHWYFNQNNLKATLAYHGMRVEFIHSHWFPREILLVAKPCSDGLIERDPILTGQSHVLDDSLSFLFAMKNQLKSLSQQYERLHVLGTTSNAAFADGVLEAQCCAFVDENGAKVGGSFRGKRVLHPRDLQNNDIVVLPYGQTVQQAAERMSAVYPAKFIVI